MSYGVTENVLRCDACTVTPQDKDATPEDKVSLRSILNNEIRLILLKII